MDQLPATFVQDFHDEASVRKMKYVSFGNTGLMVSKISLGTGTLSKFYGYGYILLVQGGVVHRS